ncbi:hypothetical protein [Herbaspirillum sp. VT-16-41]|uniref:hypothetical protein n=1 Tax=Herbaspirillum sp. VT-16-41 TaxID=1953765 RepID=UPI0011158A8E|nr:hypothetical protein [Herbaspirillum sp. VT-16-41]
MKKLFHFLAPALVLGIALSTHAKEEESFKLVGMKTNADYVMSVDIRVGSSIRRLRLPTPGAYRHSFSIAGSKWGDQAILALSLDERGRIPAVAYYDVSQGNGCLVGKYGRLDFDEKTRLLIEVTYSSASEQIINRYSYRTCKLRLHDQLLDRALDVDSAQVVRRSVTRLKGPGRDLPACEYEVRDGKSVNDEPCFSF